MKILGENPKRIIEYCTLVSPEANGYKNNINSFESELFSIDGAEKVNFLIKTSSPIGISGGIRVKIFYFIAKDEISFTVKDFNLNSDNYTDFLGTLNNENTKSYRSYIITVPVLTPFAKLFIENIYKETVIVNAWSYLV